METLMINKWTIRQSLSNMTLNMDYHLIIIIGKFVVQFCESPHLHCFFLWKVCGEVQNWILDLMRWLGSLAKEQLHLHNHRKWSSILVYMPVREIVRPEVYIFVFLICINDSIDSQGPREHNKQKFVTWRLGWICPKSLYFPSCRVVLAGTIWQELPRFVLYDISILPNLRAREWEVSKQSGLYEGLLLYQGWLLHCMIYRGRSYGWGLTLGDVFPQSMKFALLLPTPEIDEAWTQSGKWSNYSLPRCMLLKLHISSMWVCMHMGTGRWWWTL